MEAFIEWLVEFVHHFGYSGIFIMTFLESTFAPIPSEVTMVPAGYLVQQGKMNLFLVLFSSITGTIAGSLANYWIAAHYGRRFIRSYGKYMFFGPDKMDKLDRYFASHGEVSIFTGRLIPALRHVISFPAGLAHMDLGKFTRYTAAGGSIWMATLITVGYVIGDNEALVRQYMPYVVTAALAVVFLTVIAYIARRRRRMEEEN